jgi:hypothetical protein
LGRRQPVISGHYSLDVQHDGRPWAAVELLIREIKAAIRNTESKFPICSGSWNEHQDASPMSRETAQQRGILFAFSELLAEVYGPFYTITSTLLRNVALKYENKMWMDL